MSDASTSKFLAIDVAFHPGHDEDDTIPLSSIPDALARLDIPVDDDVLQVFNNAASGWSAPTSTAVTEGASVTRKDFRAVCTVLLDIEAEEPSTPPTDNGGGFVIEDGAVAGGGFLIPSDREEDEEMEEEDDDVEEDDEYESEQASDNLSDSEEEYTNDQPSTSRRTRTRARHRLSSTSSSSSAHTPKPLTASQKKEALTAFALFFPALPVEQLSKQRLKIRDINRVASLLKEKITAEETVEMLTTFSTSPDASMGLSDFERMMQAAAML